MRCESPAGIKVPKEGRYADAPLGDQSELCERRTSLFLLDLSLGSGYHSFHAPSPEECGKRWVGTLITECGRLTREVVHFTPERLP